MEFITMISEELLINIISELDGSGLQDAVEQLQDFDTVVSETVDTLTDLEDAGTSNFQEVASSAEEAVSSINEVEQALASAAAEAENLGNTASEALDNVTNNANITSGVLNGAAAVAITGMFYEAATSAGSFDDQVQALNISLDGTNTSANEAVSIIGKVATEYGIGGAAARQFAIVVSNAGAKNVESIATFEKNIRGMGYTANKSFEEISGLFEKAALRGQVMERSWVSAGISLENMASAASMSVDEFKSHLESLPDVQSRVDFLNQTFANMPSVMQGAEKATESFNTQINELEMGVGGLIRRFGELVLPSVILFIQGLADVLGFVNDVISGLPSQVKGLLSVILTLTGAVGVAVFAWSALRTAWATLGISQTISSLWNMLIPLISLATGFDASTISALGFSGVLDLAAVNIVAFITGEEAATVATWSLTEATTALMLSLWPIIAIAAAAAAAIYLLTARQREGVETMSKFNDFLENGEQSIEKLRNASETYNQTAEQLIQTKNSLIAQGKDVTAIEAQIAEAYKNSADAAKAAEDAEAQLKRGRELKTKMESMEEFKSAKFLSNAQNMQIGRGYVDEKDIQNVKDYYSLVAAGQEQLQTVADRTNLIYSEGTRKIDDITKGTDNLSEAYKRNAENGGTALQDLAKGYDDLAKAKRKSETADNWEDAFGGWVDQGLAKMTIDWVNFTMMWDDFWSDPLASLSKIDLESVLSGFDPGAFLLAGGGLGSLLSILDQIGLVDFSGVEKWFSGLGSEIQKGWDDLANWFDQGVQSIQSWFDGLPAWFESQFQSVADWFGGLPDWLSSQVGDIWNWLVESVTSSGESIYNAAIQVGSELVAGFISFVSTLPDLIWNWLLTTAGRIASFASVAYSKAVQVGTKIVNGIINFVKTIPQKVWDELMAIGNKITAAGSILYNKARDMAQRIWDGMNSVLQRSSPGMMYHEVSDELNSMINAFISRASDGYSAARSLASSIVSGFGNPVLPRIENEGVAPYELDKPSNSFNRRGGGGFLPIGGTGTTVNTNSNTSSSNENITVEVKNENHFNIDGANGDPESIAEEIQEVLASSLPPKIIEALIRALNQRNISKGAY